MPRKKPHSKNSDRSKPSAVVREANRPKNHGASLRPLPRQNDTRLSIKSDLLELYGLPADCRVFFRRKKEYTPSEEPLILDHGKCVVIDADTLELVASVNFNVYESMSPDILAGYASSIPTFYQHAEARNRVNLNRSMQGLVDAGFMKMFGWRAASDAGRKGGE